MTTTGLERPHFTLPDDGSPWPTRSGIAFVGEARPLRPEDFVPEDPDRVSAFCLVGLERTGVLLFDEEPVDLHRVVTRSELEAGRLCYRPGSAEVGDGLDSFLFAIHDGSRWSDVPTEMILDVVVKEIEEEVPEASAAETAAAEADAIDCEADENPEETTTTTSRSGSGIHHTTDGSGRRRIRREYDLEVETSEDSAYVFTAVDVSPDKVAVAEIQITALNIPGLLQFDGMAVTVEQRISRAELEAGRLTFIPALHGKHKYFEFRVRRGPMWSTSKCSMSITVTPAYSPPPADGA